MLRTSSDGLGRLEGHEFSNFFTGLWRRISAWYLQLDYLHVQSVFGTDFESLLVPIFVAGLWYHLPSSHWQYSYFHFYLRFCPFGDFNFLLHRRKGTFSTGFDRYRILGLLAPSRCHTDLNNSILSWCLLFGRLAPY